jgi:hypothetical protein
MAHAALKKTHFLYHYVYNLRALWLEHVQDRFYSSRFFSQCVAVVVRQSAMETRSIVELKIWSGSGWMDW